MAQIIQLRRDYSSNWTLANPVLAQGELGIEFDNYNVKIGNGLSSWNELPYGLGTVSVPAHTHSYAGTGITTASTAGINIAGTLDTNGLSLGIPAWLTTYSSAAGGGEWTAATVSGTDMLVSTAGGTNTIYYPKYLTTAAEVGHDHTQYITTAAMSNHTHSDLYVNTSVSGSFLTTAALSNHVHTQYLTTAIDTNYTSHTHSQYLTTAMASNAGSLYQLTSDNSLSLGTGYSTHTHTQSTHSHPYIASESTSVFAYTTNDNLSLGTGYTTHTHNYQSVGAYLTTAMLSNANSVFLSTSQSSLFQHTSATTKFAGTGTSATNASITLNSNGLAISVAAPTAGGGVVIAGSAASTVTNGTLQFANLNGVSFGLNGSTMTASHNAYTGTTTGWLTTAAASNHTHSNLYINTSASEHFQLTSDNSLSLGTGYTTHTHNYQSQGAYLTTAAQTDHTHSNLYIPLGNSSAYQTATLASTFAQTANVMLTGERANYYYTSNNTLANSTHTHGGLTINVTNLSTSITSASNGLTINLSAANPGAGGGVAVAAAGATVTNSTVVFSNSNGVSFGGNGSTITAQIAGVGTVNFADSNGITWGSSVDGVSTTITGSVNAGGGGVALAASNQTYSSGTVQFRGTNVTINTSAGAQYVDLSVAAPSGVAPNRSMCEIIPGEYLTRLVNLSATAISGRILFNPFWLGGNGLAASTVRVIMSVVTNSTPPIMTYGAALYTPVNSTQLTLVDSTTATVNYASSQSASYSGIRAWDITGMTKTLSEGRYMLALFFSGSASAAMNASLYGASAWPAIAGFVSGNSGTLATNNTVHLFPFQGAYSAVSSQFPSTVGIAEIRGGRAAEAIDYYAILKEI